MKQLSLGLLYLCCFLGCKDEMTQIPLVQVDNQTQNPDAQYLNLDSDYLFNQDSLYTYELIIPGSNLALINSDPAAEQYVEGILVFQGDTLSPVGIRYKGSIGAFAGCVSNFSLGNPSGHKTCTKLSMKVKINWEEEDAKFYGLRKLQFHAMNLDNSLLRDRLGYWLFREMDIPAPRCVHARLIINGEYNGIFALVENIDGRFAKHNYSNSDGNIYKEVWPITDAGEPTPTGFLINGLKTNEELQNTVLMEAFGEALATEEDESALQSIVETYNDLEEILTYSVIDRVIRHDDGPFHWYCGGGDCGNHNYYWYEDPTDQKLRLIPWDLDNAFDNIISANNAVVHIPDDWGEISNDCEPFASSFWTFIEQRSAACDKLTHTWTLYDDEYAQIKEEFLATVFSQDNVNQQIEDWTDQIEAAVQQASDLHNDAPTVGQWKASVETLQEQLSFARTQ